MESKRRLEYPKIAPPPPWFRTAAFHPLRTAAGGTILPGLASMSIANAATRRPFRPAFRPVSYRQPATSVFSAMPQDTPAGPLVSVIVCTYNRCANLPGCIERLGRQDGVKDLAWETVVVDNNSTDDTKRTVEELQRRHPRLRLRYVFESEQGLSAARNGGIRATTGPYYLFIDDDIRVSPGWLKAMTEALRDNDADAVGGRIHLEHPEDLPKWIRPDMYGFLGFQDFGDRPRRLDGRKEFPFGGNMGFHRRILDQVGQFDTAYGRKGAGKKREELLKGEETVYFHRLADQGGRIVYAPGGLVYHRFEPFQAEKRYFRTIHYNQGLLQGLHDDRPHGRRLFGVPRFVFGQAGRALKTYLGLVFRQGPDAAFRQQMNTGYFLGMIRGYRQARRNAAGA